MSDMRKLAEKVKREFDLRCNCDLDKWEPEKDTGHSIVCRIHKTTLPVERIVKDINQQLTTANEQIAGLNRFIAKGFGSGGW